MSDKLDYLLMQARNDEFAIDDQEAGSMTAQEYANKYGLIVEGNQSGDGLWRVTRNGTDYFWNPDTGKYDGWGKGLKDCRV